MLAGVVALVTLAVLGLTYIFVVDGQLLRPYRDSFGRNDVSDWKFYGGTWKIFASELENLSGERGDKAVVGSRRWSDYVVDTDVRLNAAPADSLYGDVGVIFRVTDASAGVDSYDGYYAGVGSDGNILLLGRANYSWARLRTAPLGVEAARGSWFHLRVLAKGCYFEAVATDLRTGKVARLSYFEPDCAKRSGAVGVRTYGLPAAWKNFFVHRVAD